MSHTRPLWPQKAADARQGPENTKPYCYNGTCDAESEQETRSTIRRTARLLELRLELRGVLVFGAVDGTLVNRATDEGCERKQRYVEQQAPMSAATGRATHWRLVARALDNLTR